MTERAANDPWLSPEQVTELTGYVWKRKQCEALAEMGYRFIPCKRTGRPLVECAVVLKYRDRPKPKAPEPNWDAINAA